MFNSQTFANTFIYILLFILVIILFSVLNKKRIAEECKILRDRWQNPRIYSLLEAFENPRAFWCISAILFLLALFVRVYRLGAVPVGINMDEAMGMVDAKALADYGTDRLGMHMPVHFTGRGYGQMSVLLSYIAVPFIKLFGLNEISVRVPLVIISMLGLTVIFLYVKEFMGKSAGLIVLFLLAINPWHIMQARWALDCNVFPHFVALGIFFYIKVLIKSRSYI